MAMTVLDRVPVDRITEQARELHPGRTLLTLLAALLYGLGWLAGKTVMGVWFVLAWSFAAVKVGWTDARGGSGGGTGQGGGRR